MLIEKTHGRFTEAAVDDELLLMHLDSGEFHGLSGTSLEIWRLLDSEKDPATIVATLVERYDVDPATAPQRSTRSCASWSRAVSSSPPDPAAGPAR